MTWDEKRVIVESSQPMNSQKRWESISRSTAKIILPNIYLSSSYPYRICAVPT
jgi:hypothetical protein